jgi:hypothetical protein
MESAQPPPELDLEEDETLLGGLARRLAWMAAGAGVVLVVGALAPAWVGLLVLAVWFLPLLLHAALRQLPVMGALALLVLAGFGRDSWEVVGFVAVTVLEEVLLVVTVALLGGSLL